LDLIHLVSNWMFGLFLTGTVLSFVLIFVMPISVYTRWLALPVAILAFLNALFVTVASVIATVMFVIFRNTITGVSELNIGAVKAFKPAQLSTPILVVLHFQPSAAPRPNAAVAAHSCR
jgi:hypothetical protein